MKKQQEQLKNLCVFGFEDLEPLILASLVTEDPILLIGKAGTGKTYLLNRISEALALRHRHYNASLLSFDDLVGFPYPVNDNTEIRFIPTPASVWEAESVLIDELNRCKPETQNKFFSIIHEKKLQGIPLGNLRFRWAAMNPFSFTGDAHEETYSGSLPLDPALADRFAFILEVPDWADLSEANREAIVRLDAEQYHDADFNSFIQSLEKSRMIFRKRIATEDAERTLYCRVVADLFGQAGLRISPRRARMLARNITALLSVVSALGLEPEGRDRKHWFKTALKWSIPQRAYQEELPSHAIDSAHAEAIRIIGESDLRQRWLSDFMSLPSLKTKLARLLQDDADIDIKSIAVLQLLGQETPSRRSAFAFAAFPYLLKEKLLNDEALQELSKAAAEVMHVQGEMKWHTYGYGASEHPDWTSCQNYLGKLPEKKLRSKRARQFFLHLLAQKIPISSPQLAEEELNGLFELVSEQAQGKSRAVN